MTRNVNDPLPDHYGTDDWENTDTLTSHLHGDGEASVQTMEIILAETIWNEHLFHVDALLYGDKMITPDMKMAEKLAKIVSDAVRRRSEPSEPVAVKALEWLGNVCPTPAGIYRLKELSGQWVVTYENSFPSWHSTIAEAKAAAQADFDQRIRSALEPVAVTDEMVERAMVSFYHDVPTILSPETDEDIEDLDRWAKDMRAALAAALLVKP